MALVYLGLGSNLGDRQAYLRQALTMLEQAGVRLRQHSKIYETEPVGFKDQGWFLNCVLALETNLAPPALLEQTQKIEQALGRERAVRFGPRTVDIDILLYDNLVLETDTLAIPHPRLHERRFVLVPLAAIAPECQHPLLNQSISQLLRDCPDTSRVKSYILLDN